MIEVEKLWKSFGTQRVLRALSSCLPPRQRLCLLGPSGAGKTTLLRIIAGLEQPDSGVVRIGQEAEGTGRRVSKSPAIGMVFQSLALWPHMTARRNIEFVLIAGTRSQRRQRAAELLEMVHLPDRADAYPSQLSGGQQQRLAIARALASSPQLLLLDEPLKSLDEELRQEIADLLATIIARERLTVICATQQPEAVRPFTDRVARLRDGTLEFEIQS